MNVLVACEESQAVTKEFRALGHEAYSCDIIDQSGGHPEWHIMKDVLPLLNGVCSFKTTDGVEHTISGRWDMIIAFPPCTKTSNAGARHLWKGGRLNIPRYFDGLCGKALFLAIWAADCDKVVIENPTPSSVFEYPKPTQSVQPYEFGHPFTKKHFSGSEVLSLSNRRISLLQRERGVLPVLTQEITEKSIVGCSRKTGQKTEAKHSRALQKQWLINGVVQPMNNDLIRRSDLLAKKCLIRGRLDQGSPCPTKITAIPVDVIERATAVDAVEVVRCKDCQNARRGGSGYVWCGDRTIPLNGFCSYGERKEERNDKK